VPSGKQVAEALRLRPYVRPARGSAWNLLRLHFVWHPASGASRPQGLLPFEGLLDRLAHAAKPPARVAYLSGARPVEPVAGQVLENQL
jgi:hypothetical protein